MTVVSVLPVIDSPQLADSLRRTLSMDRGLAAELGASAVAACRQGFYEGPLGGRRVFIADAVAEAVRSKVSVPPDETLPAPTSPPVPELRVQVRNETTMTAGRRFVAEGRKTLALNFANGVQPGGGFLVGARAQEESLCRSSALFLTLQGDPMYDAHRQRDDRASSDWSILSPRVPFFRDDAGEALAEPWSLDVVTCAAPIADGTVGRLAADLLRRRIARVLAIATGYGYEALVLGAWGCGAFGNDPAQTARDFRDALCGPYLGAFHEVVFAITDWSEARRFLGPFRDAFGGAAR